MKKVHFILQGKGGVGKTYIASLLAQFHQEQDKDIICIDTDPVNSTFSGYKAFNVKRLELMERNELNPRKFDQMVQELVEVDSNFIIDNGAASFLPLSTYLLENDVFNMLNEKGKEVYVHTLITGSQGLRDTLTGFNKLAEHLPESVKLIVWLNEYFGSIMSEEGKPFMDMKVYTKNQHKISGLITIPRQTATTFGQDVEMMLTHRATFAEVKENPIFELMAKQRLTMVKRNLFTQIEAVVV
jgi:hypothetical protein